MRVHPVHFAGELTLPVGELNRPFERMEQLEFAWPTQVPVVLPSVLAIGKRDLLSLLADHGFMNASITNEAFVPSPDKQWVDVTLTLDEGPRYRLGDLTVRRAPDTPALVDDSALRGLFALSRGDWLSRGALWKGASAVVEIYARAHVGLDAVLDCNPLADKTTMDVTVTLERKDDVDRIVELRVEGVEGDDAKELERAAGLHVGDRVDTVVLLEARRRVAAARPMLAYVEARTEGRTRRARNHVVLRARSVDDTNPP